MRAQVILWSVAIDDMILKIISKLDHNGTKMTFPPTIHVGGTSLLMFLHLGSVTFEKVTPEAKMVTMILMQVKEEILFLFHGFFTHMTGVFRSVCLFSGYGVTSL